MYKLVIEFKTLEDAKAVQSYVEQNYNSDEVYWNAVSKIETKK